MDDDAVLTPPEVANIANVASLGLLPEKSRALYQKTYDDFISWCVEKQVTRYSESVLLAYFSDIAQKGLIASLWPKYSMLRSTLSIYQDVDITKYRKLIMFIKRQREGYMPKKSKVLEKEHVQKFLSDAPNNLFLMTKVALIFGVAGALRKDELLKLETEDVQDLGSKFLVTIRSTKTKTNRIFTVVENEQKILLNLIRRYVSLRPKNTPHKRFFIFYRNNECTRQPIGINTFSKLPSRIATYLRLDEPHLYTGHCFRRSSASILSDAGADFAAIKRLGGWKSTAVAEGYIEDSIQNKMKTATKIFSDPTAPSTSINSTTVGILTEPSTSVGARILHTPQPETLDNSDAPSFSFNNCTITHLNITICKPNPQNTQPQ